MKLASQIVPPAVDPNDIANQTFVERLGGRGSPEFVYAVLSGTQAYAADTAITYSADSSRGLTVSSGTFGTLKAGRTYYLQAQPRLTHSAAAEVEFQWYDQTNAAFIGRRAVALTTTDTTNANAHPQAVCVCVPAQDITVEVRMRTGGTAGSDMGSFSWALIYEIPGPAIAGPMEFIETIEVTGSAVQALTFSGLNGDEDEHYVMIGDWVNGAGGVAETTLEPNGTTPTAESEGFTINAGTVTGNTTTDMRVIPGSSFSGAFRVDFFPRTGQERRMIAEAVLSNASAVASKSWSYWSDTSTNVTSLVLQGDVASTFGVGTRVSLYRIRAQNFPENSFSPGHLDGLQMSFNTVSTVDIAAGTAKDSTGKRDITVSSTLTADITASGANGLDTGSEASSTWYALYVIDGLTVAPAALLSTSFSSPTLPAGYDVFRRVGAVRNNGSSNIEDFVQRGAGRDRLVSWDDYTQFNFLSAGAATTNTTISAAIGMPPSSTRAHLGWQFIPNAQGNDARIFYPGAGQLHWFHNAVGAGAAGDDALFGQQIWTNTSQQVEYRVASASDALYLWITGYWDEL